MKIIEKIALIIYSIIVLILSVVCCLLIFNWLQLDSIINILENMLEYHYISTTVLVVSIIFILLSLKCIFFGSKKSDIPAAIIMHPIVITKYIFNVFFIIKITYNYIIGNYRYFYTLYATSSTFNLNFPGFMLLFSFAVAITAYVSFSFSRFSFL